MHVISTSLIKVLFFNNIATGLITEIHNIYQFNTKQFNETNLFQQTNKANL